MLTELTISDLAIIDELHLQLATGFNVLTGETGAGKSIIIDAVSLLLGGRADSGVVRTGADVATIEGIFYVSAEEREELDPVLAQDALQGEDPDTLVLAREIRRNGHNVCRVNGRAVRLGVLEAIGQTLVDIHGQGDHLSLLHERSHLDFLDRYGGLEVERLAVAEQVEAIRAVRRELDDLVRNERELSRRADQLRYQVEEIEAAHLQTGEDAELEQEQRRLANAEKLAELSREALALLSGGQAEGKSVVDTLGQAVRMLANLARLDPQAVPHHRQAEELEYQLDDLVRTLYDYQEGIEFNPARLNRVEERLTLIRRLQRRYGDSIPDVLAFGAEAAAELNRIEHSGERIADLQAQEAELLERIGELGLVLSEHRRDAAERLSSAVEAELGELKMENARFAVDIQWEQKADGATVARPTADATKPAGRYSFDAKGLDRVAFLIAPNIGEPLKPLAKVASGGETSRLMLALKTALSNADRVPILIFDEIDQGIGGRVGSVVGLKLLSLSQVSGGVGRQVFCVTHLPQLAGWADLHLHVSKTVAEGRTKTIVEALDEEAQERELAQMLGADSESTRKAAREIMSARRAVTA